MNWDLAIWAIISIVGAVIIVLIAIFVVVARFISKIASSIQSDFDKSSR